MRIYVAGSLDDAARVRQVQAALLGAGHHIQHDWTEAGDVGLSDYAAHPIEASRVALADLDAVTEADAVVVIVPPRGGRGLWVELGVALASAASRPVAPVFVMADDPDASVFLHHPGVRLVDDVPSILSALARRPIDRVEGVAAAPAGPGVDHLECPERNVTSVRNPRRA